MSTAINTNQSRFNSPLGYLGNLTVLFLEKFTKRKLKDASGLIQSANDSDIEFLESLNSYSEYSITELDEFEEMINARKFLMNILEVMHNDLSESKNQLPDTDSLYNELTHFCNSFYNLIETNRKVHSKLDEVHNKILTKASENISSDILDSVWEGEDDVWDSFYLESQNS